MTNKLSRARCPDSTGRSLAGPALPSPLGGASILSPGSRFVERRPCTGGEKLFLVEVGSKQYRATRDMPADCIELIVLGRCDEAGRIIEQPEFGPRSFRVAPGVFLDTRYFTPLGVEQREAA